MGRGGTLEKTEASLDKSAEKFDKHIRSFFKKNGVDPDNTSQVCEFLKNNKNNKKLFVGVFKKVSSVMSNSAVLLITLQHEEPSKKKVIDNTPKAKDKIKAFITAKKSQYKLTSSYEKRKKICLEAVSRDGMALDYFREFQTDADCVYAAVMDNPWAYGHARIEGYNSQTDGKNDPRIVAEVFKSDYRCIRFIGERFSEKWYNVEIMLHFRPELFQFFADGLRMDANYCLSKMSQITTDFYKYVHPKLYKNAHFMMEAYGLNGACFDRLDISLRKDGRFILNCIDRYGTKVLAYADKSLYKNRAFMRELLSKHPEAVNMIGILGINNDELLSIVAKNLVELLIINKELLNLIPANRSMEKKILMSYSICLTDKKLTRQEIETSKNRLKFDEILQESNQSILDASRGVSSIARIIDKMAGVEPTVRYNANMVKQDSQRQAVRTIREYATFIERSNIRHEDGIEYTFVEIAKMSVEQRQMLDLMMERGVKQVRGQSYIGIDITGQTTIDQVGAFLRPKPKTMTTPANAPVLTRFDNWPKP